jgi:2-dehydro-3-deoxyphosphogluconate aldolase/(4S)-4-hydroxy-2-oxoglutarate aldolase
MSEVVDFIGQHRLIGIVRTDSPRVAEGSAHAAYEGGLRVLEITFSVPEAPGLITRLSSDLEDAIIGAGTVLDTTSVRAAIDAGARFIVAPNTDPEVIQAAQSAGVCVCPGAATPTEVAHARRLGADLIKIFPAFTLGGPDYIRALLQPLPELRLVPTGGVNPDDVVTYLRAGCFAVGLGGALFYRGIDTAADALAIAARARGLVERVQNSTI